MSWTAGLSWIPLFRLKSKLILNEKRVRLTGKKMFPSKHNNNNVKPFSLFMFYGVYPIED